MPVIFRASGLRFIIYTDDHVPAHVHVEGKGGSAKVAIDDARLVWSRQFSRRDIVLALNVVRNNRLDFMMAWQNIHG